VQPAAPRRRAVLCSTRLVVCTAGPRDPPARAAHRCVLALRSGGPQRPGKGPFRVILRMRRPSRKSAGLLRETHARASATGDTQRLISSGPDRLEKHSSIMVRSSVASCTPAVLAMSAKRTHARNRTLSLVEKCTLAPSCRCARACKRARTCMVYSASQSGPATRFFRASPTWGRRRIHRARQTSRATTPHQPESAGAPRLASPRLASPPPRPRTELEHPHTLCRVRRDVRHMAPLCTTGEEYLAACAAEPIQRPDVRGDLLGAYGRSAGLVRQG
jgi:hypothetical protein